MLLLAAYYTHGCAELAESWTGVGIYHLLWCREGVYATMWRRGSGCEFETGWAPA